MNVLWGFLIIEELVRNRINLFCISPGSRSTPLTTAAARNKSAKTKIFFDERGAAFYTLGYARATGKPAVLICTSGTAAANYYPAVIEAAVDHVPLIVISADRPPELRQTGANQTIRQVNLFGDYPKWQFDLPCPDNNISPQMVLTTVDQLAYQAQQHPPGPVHLNCMFREPFFDDSAKSFDAFSQLQPFPRLKNWQQSNSPYTKYDAGTSVPEPEAFEKIAANVISEPEGVIVAGKMAYREEFESVLSLAKKLGWPVFPDVTSGLRLGNTIKPVIAYFDQLLLSETFKQRFKPKTVLHIGGQIVSKRWLQFVEKNSPENYIVVQNHPFRYDPAHIVTRRLECDIPAFCRQLGFFSGGEEKSTLLDTLALYSEVVENTIEQFMRSNPELNEISVARLVSETITSGSGLFLASSMPVRDMDMYAVANGNPVSVAANRGASGIDGTIASAAGFVAGLNAPVTLVIGDLAFIHDLSSLSLLANTKQPLVIVLINNCGGGIFSFLPISQQEDIFEQFFCTPHSLEFQHAAKMAGLFYYQPKTIDEFIKTYQKAITKKKTTIIEVQTDRDENKRLHLQLQNSIVSQIEKLVIVIKEPNQ